jgi:thiamine biosynthesis lipoprotein
MIRVMSHALRKLGALLALCTVGAAACAPSPPPAIRSVSGFAQGTTYSLQWTGPASEAAIATAAEQELERIDTLLSNYRPDSTLERFNAVRGTELVELSGELVTLLSLAKVTHEKSDGCFDPTVRPLVRAWGFDAGEPTVPAPESLAAARAAVGLDKLEIADATHVRKTQAELELDMASIGQGYTVGRLATLLEQHGSEAYLAELGGEVVARGAKPGGAPWRVGVENPAADAAAGTLTPALRMPTDAATAVVTSGSYRQYFEIAGRRFGHVIDPRTGWPVEHGLLSVTVVGPDAATAAAWGTALLCLGPTAAREIAERENVAALFWIDAGGSAALELTPKFETDWRDRLDAPAAR